MIGGRRKPLTNNIGGITMKHKTKIERIETCINDIQNFIQMYKDGVYDDDTEFLEDIEANAESILFETQK